MTGPGSTGGNVAGLTNTACDDLQNQCAGGLLGLGGWAVGVRHAGRTCESKHAALWATASATSDLPLAGRVRRSRLCALPTQETMR